MSRKDILTATIIGVLTGALWAGVFGYLKTFEIFLIKFSLPDTAVWGLVIAVPIVFVFGLYLGLWLSRWKRFFISFSRFVMVGFLNAGVDFGVFNLLMFLTKIEVGLMVSLFKAASFIASFTNSYFWNKYWAFEASTSEGGSREFFKFAFVTVVGLIINVGTTSAVVLFVDPQFGFSQLAWNNIAAVAGAVGGLAWNFLGYRFIVFKKEAANLPKGQTGTIDN